MLFGALIAIVTLLGTSQPTVRLATKHPVAAFAVSGKTIAWLDGRNCGVHITGARAQLLRTTQDYQCQYDALALAGGRVAWGGDREVKCSGDFWIVATGGAGQPGRVVENRSSHCFQGGHALAGIAGGGSSLYVSYVRFDEVNDCANSANQCDFRLRGGSIVRLVNGRKVPFRGLPPAALLAASGSEIAIVRPEARHRSKWGRQEPGTFPLRATGPLEVRNGVNGQLVRSIALGSPAEALALSPGVVAVVVVGPGGTRTLQWYSRTGAQLGSIKAGRTRVTALATAGGLIAFRTGGAIHVVSAASGKELGRWNAPAPPFSLVVQAGHVLWAVNAGGHGRILDARVSAP